ncbi:threonine aldolase family protein [Halapricum hydrolyticum]|uniref:Beta-eliminating lyase-related protein n=1 Tax=Halapricum hydrolyticum TaxID=2979991 RepID=A0AAE3IFD6_9EURY|nr:GntG family PLP-dependent aldolase [Halapricum hydrolyticum]MCU4719212.1 beta-eliminating lyase-related protein [Halapricum hydrolyticum]MCU4728303.1 beta-eliminating lyase-related protein [Halapricum hydrolyticum]
MIDLRSDTVTKPSDEMREAAAEAEVGDDVYGEDPTVNELEARMADMLGKEAALYVPSGTMGNQIAVRAHTERGQEVLLEEECHTYKWELGGIAQHSQVQARTIDGGDRGVVGPGQVHDGYVEGDDHRPGTGLLVLENTHNSKGGTAIAPERIDEAAQAAHDHGVPVHLDGARLFNAATALDVPADRIVREVDTVMSCLSKGLGAPVGSMLAGPDEFIERARRIRKLMGGGMRQAGLIAAPGLLALENRDRLHEDHRRARELAAGFGDVPGLSPSEPETNIVLVETDEPADVVLDRLRERGVAGSAFGEHTIRFCTHWDIDDADIEAAIETAASL